MQQLWEHFFDRLVRQAQQRLIGTPTRVLDGEDIAASVFESLWRGAQEGRFENIRHRDELWWLLLALVQRKTASHVRRETALKRGGNSVVESLSRRDGAGRQLHELLSEEPTGEFVALFEEEYRRILDILRDDDLRRIAVLKIEGYTNREISVELGVATVTVTRKLKLIRATWEREMQR